MNTIALALSGGGFRATLHHLGVVRYLRDAGILRSVSDIAAVSGGSILAAHLALNWSRYCGSDEDFAAAAAEVIRFVQFDVRNRIVRRLPLLFPFRLAARLTGLPAGRLAPNALLERYYRNFLYGDRRLFELPASPAVHILATNVSDGVLAVFNRDGLHVQSRDPDHAGTFRHVPGWTAPIAKVVGASSAFPGFFPPVEITAADIGARDGQFSTESFTDGGVYDNLGIRAIRWLKDARAGTPAIVLVSDAGKPFQILDDASLGFIAQSIRATDILWDRVWQLERENFGERDGFHFIPITRVVGGDEDPHALPRVVQAEVGSIRTDLDRFTDLEINALVGHGYEVARSVHRRLADPATGPVHEGPVWLPQPGAAALRGAPADGSPAAGTARQAATNPVARIAADLRRSGRRRTVSALFAPGDWPSWVFLALGLVAFVVLPLRFWHLNHRARMLTGVIDSIAKGDPDIRLVLDLVENDPLDGWRPIAITPAETLRPNAVDGAEILARSRIVDLRRAWVGVGPRDGLGTVQIRDRLTVRVAEGAAHPVIRLRSTNALDEIEYRQPAGQPPITARRGVEEVDGRPVTRYELTCDLSGAPRGVPVAIEMALRVRYARMLPGRMPSTVDHPCDILTMWMLFPEDHPYRTYRLLRHPRGREADAEPLVARYTIDHPYGTLIGWSIVKPEPDTVYECCWTGD
ncbi:MAG: patatin-like phospholipase family protein [Planctomycetota bacterium]